MREFREVSCDFVDRPLSSTGKYDPINHTKLHEKEFKKRATLN